MKFNASFALIIALSVALSAATGRASDKTDRVITSNESRRGAEFTPVATAPDVANAQWTDIKDVNYDSRAKFFAGLIWLNTKVDLQVDELNAQRAAMTSAANPKDWDFAMKEMVNAQAYLVATGKEMNAATSETWDQQKEKVGLAWTRTQEAYAKVKSSVTN